MKNIIILFIVCLMACGTANAQTPHDVCPTTPANATGTVKITNVPFIINNPDTLNPPPPPPPTGGGNIERVVYWVHGLAGSNGSFSKAAEATQFQIVPDFPARKVYCYSPEYTEYTLQSAALNLGEVIQTEAITNVCEENNISRENNFIIAHSQGGLVSRKLDQYYEDPNSAFSRAFGGIVTFGTMHQGARILNNKAMFDGFVLDACNDIAPSIILEAINDLPLPAFLFSQNTIAQIQGFFCDQLLPKLIGGTFKDFSVPITEDYKVGAPALNTLNSYQSTIPRVAFVGTEDDPVMWRTLYSLIKKQPNEFPTFEADQDDIWVKMIDSIQNVYTQKIANCDQEISDFENGLFNCDNDWSTDNWGWLGYNPLTLGYALNQDIQCSNYYSQIELRKALVKGRNWFLTADDKFRAIIGALNITTLEESVCDCTDPSSGMSFNFPSGGDPANCNAQGLECDHMVIVNTIIDAKPSDGVVLAESQSAWEGAILAPMPGSNHQQMRNDSNTKKRLRALFDGDHGSYFKLKEQQ